MKGNIIMLKKIRNLWTKSIALCALAVVIAICGVGAYLALRDSAPRHEFETSGSEINFGDPSIRVHTAGDGIAVIGRVRSGGNAAISPIRLTSDPATIWQNDNSHTHGGFTLPVQMSGESIGVLTIPDIGLSVRVYEGEDAMELMDRGVALFRHTSSWYGNTGLSAHNVNMDGTPGYFLNIHRLPKGAVIQYQTVFGTREYMVESIAEISQYDWSWLGRTEDNRLTLITCITGRPDWRLVVQAVEKV